MDDNIGNLNDLAKAIGGNSNMKRIGISMAYRDNIGEYLFDFGDNKIFAIWGWYGGSCLQESFVSGEWLSRQEIAELESDVAVQWINLPR